MNLDSLKKKFNEILIQVSETGLSLAYIKDPQTKKASVSLTLLVVSFTIVVVGIVSKPGKIWDIDMAQAFNLLYLTTGLYFGRKVTSKNGNVEITQEDSAKKESEKSE